MSPKQSAPPVETIALIASAKFCLKSSAVFAKKRVDFSQYAIYCVHYSFVFISMLKKTGK